VVTGNLGEKEGIQRGLLLQPAGFQCFKLEPMIGIEPMTYSLRGPNSLHKLPICLSIVCLLSHF